MKLKRLELKSNGKVTGFGEVMLRLTCPGYKKILQCSEFDTSFGGAEFNVINSLSIFGVPTKFATVLPSNPFGEGILKDLKSNFIDTSSITFSEGRLGMYFLEQGFGTRGSNVIYDRKYSCFSLANRQDFDCEEILKDVSLLHISGITPALSTELNEFSLDLVKTANKKGILVSYDSNYRSKLWSLETATSFTKDVLSYVDIAFLGILDMKNILQYAFPSTSKTLQESLSAGYKRLFNEYPQLKLAACTNRIAPSMDNNSLQGFLFDGAALHESSVYSFDILDRVGAGDAFAAGILYKAINSENYTDIVEFGTAASVLKHSIKGDVNIITEQEIVDYMNKGLQNIIR